MKILRILGQLLAALFCILALAALAGKIQGVVFAAAATIVPAAVRGAHLARMKPGFGLAVGILGGVFGATLVLMVAFVTVIECPAWMRAFSFVLYLTLLTAFFEGWVFGLTPPDGGGTK